MPLEVQIQNLAYGGDAMGRLPDGRAVFVPFCLPGERVLVEIVEEKRNFVRARLVKVLQASPERIEPRCPHFTECGGCHYQHLPYEAQLAAKSAILQEQLQRIAGIASPPMKPICPSPEAWNYRNNLQFHPGSGGRLGFEAAGSNRVIPIRECHLPEPALDGFWQQLDIEPIPGLERVGLRSGSNGEILLTLESSTLDLPEMELDLPVSVVQLSPAGALVLAGEPLLWMQVLDTEFQVSAGSFFQVNTPMAGEMVRQALEWLQPNRQSILLDVYCGVGLFSRFFAPLVDTVIGVESSESAVDDYAVNLDAFDNISAYLGAAEEILPHLELQPTMVIVDPPRAGLALPALDALVRMAAPQILYVSCDPATLARDVKRLAAAGYTLEAIRPFDLFPQTYHVESISLLTRN